MKSKHFFILLAIGCLKMSAQSALYNSGNLQIHQNGQLGLHTNLINGGILDENLGWAGFYGNEPITVSGAFVTTFNNLEIANPQNVVLSTSINTLNTTNFIAGNFVTARNATDNYLNFIATATSINSGDISKVDGYVAINNQQNFTFPVGDAVHLRPLVINSDNINSFAKCAYFFENPNSPTTFSTNFNTTNKTEVIGLVNEVEFWRLEGSLPSTIQLSWNARSNITALTNDPATIVVVGWSKATNKWESLAGDAATGDISQGFVSSKNFIPDDYEVLTLASTLKEPSGLISVDNYLVTPNGDGVNDSFVIPELKESPNNSVQIFNRFGLKVFEMENYADEFVGFANSGILTTGKQKGLPFGVYFFIVQMHDLNLDFQGFLYLAK